MRLSLCDLPQLESLCALDGFMNVQVRKMKGVDNLRELKLFRRNSRSTWHLDKERLVIRKRGDDGSLYLKEIMDWVKEYYSNTA